MVRHLPCWHLDLLSDSDAKSFFGKRPKFTGIGTTEKLQLTVFTIEEFGNGFETASGKQSNR